MGGVNCIQTFFGFLDFFYIYKVPKPGCDTAAMLHLFTVSLWSSLKHKQ